MRSPFVEWPIGDGRKRKTKDISAPQQMLDALGDIQPLDSASRAIASVAFVATLCLTALLEQLQYRLRAFESSRWWASNGRDVLSAIALLGVYLGLKALGFSTPIALAIGSTQVIAVISLQGALAHYPRLSSWLSLGLSLLLGAPVLIAPARIHDAFRALLEFLW